MNYYNYFTEIEEHFIRRRGKGLLVSPMDWSLIATWRDTGVPLHVALRGVDLAMDSFQARRTRDSQKVNTLFYCHDTVMEEYARHLESRLGEERPSAGEGAQGAEPERAGEPDSPAIQKFLEDRILEMKGLLAKLLEAGDAAEELAGIVQRLEEIARDRDYTDPDSLERDLGILDEDLVRTLQDRIPQEVRDEWEKEAKKELKVYRKRLPRETYMRILHNFMRGKIHRHFNLGELSLFHVN